jgi:hypothetical protein
LYYFSHLSFHAKRRAWKDAAVFDFNCLSRVVSQQVFALRGLTVIESDAFLFAAM